ncbi:MAG: hypothetical protein DRN27_02850 [Thermoplasmata archaeon]|nr:MAG: hypothetical protein DRN27_02850 [Thermoplasmata archaeon]
MFLIPNINVSAAPQFVSVHIIDSDPVIDEGNFVIVGGIWHQVSIQDDGLLDKEVTLILFKGNLKPTIKNISNYYEWIYNPTANIWQSNPSYTEQYFQLEKSKADAQSLDFCIGVKDTLPNKIYFQQEWTIEILYDGVVEYSKTVIVEKPTRGFAKSHGDHINFQIDPFKQVNKKASDYIMLKNTGNIPMDITISYDGLDEYLSYVNSEFKIPQHSKQQYNIELNAPSWKPQLFKQTGVATAKVNPYYIVEDEKSGTAISLQTALVIDVPSIDIHVGHSNYVLQTLKSKTGLSFQYKDSVYLKEGETKQINAYVSGEGSAKISIDVDENIEILSITKNNNEVPLSFSTYSNNNEEIEIAIKIRSKSENNHGYVYYTVETDENEDIFSTSVTVGAPVSFKEQNKEIQGTSFITVVVLIGLVIVSAYMLYNHLVYGRKS